jgi:hypothetical protein
MFSIFAFFVKLERWLLSIGLRSFPNNRESIKIFRVLLFLMNKVSNVDHIRYRITTGNCLTHIVTHDECITNEELFYYLEKMVALGKCVSWVQKKTDFHDCLEKTLNLFTIWKSIVYNLFCRDGIYFHKILVSEYKLFKSTFKCYECGYYICSQTST